MTESHWLTSTSTFVFFHHLAQLPDRSDRKSRLAAVACCRRAAEWLPDLLLAEVIDESERCADDPEGWRRLFTLNRKVREYHDRMRGGTEALDLEHSEFISAVDVLTGWPIDPTDCFEWCRDAICGHDDFGAGRGETLFQIDLIYDIFGNPFRPVPYDPSWRTSAAVSLASQIYESRDFAAMPILADALQDAGCDHADILAHCRDANAVHVRGCWVVDLVLGKS
jgi:hypothetical protein